MPSLVPSGRDRDGVVGAGSPGGRVAAHDGCTPPAATIPGAWSRRDARPGAPDGRSSGRLRRTRDADPIIHVDLPDGARTGISPLHPRVSGRGVRG